MPGSMSDFYVEVGHRVRFSKTVSESDVYLFAGITGDLAPNHVNKEFMAATRYRERIAHGALMVGFMSTASTMALAHLPPGRETAVSLGYDRLRFLAPVFIGDTITVVYEITEIDPERRRTRSKIEITNQEGVLTTVGEHILKWVPND